MKEKKMRKDLFFSALVLMLTILTPNLAAKGNTEKQDLVISSTTSLRDSGLMDAILPDFTEKTGIQTKLIGVGTGKALQMGRDGEADVLLVHAKPSEEQFVAEGHGLKRWEVMYNDFVLVGPPDDPAGIAGVTHSDILAAFSYISEQDIPFVSRGDNSGTHKKEMLIWDAAGITPEFGSLVSAGSGMAAVLRMASEKQAYTLTDRGTFLKLSPELDLKVVVEGDDLLLNMYGVIAVNPEKNELINAEGAQEFIQWILSNPVQGKIGEYEKEKYGRSLFNPLFPAESTD